MLGRSPFQIGKDIEEIHSRLAQIDRKLDLVLRHLRLSEGAGERPAPSPQVLSLLRSGHRLQAIKAYHEESGLSAGEAELVLDAVSRQQATGGPRQGQRNEP